MEHQQCRVSSGRLHVERTGRLVVVAASGVMALQDALDAIRRVRAFVAECAADGVLVDIRGCLLAISIAGYAEVIRVAVASPIRQPMAFVAGPVIMTFAHAHQVLMGRAGLKRAFFADPERARAWLARQSAARQPVTLA